MKIFNLIFFSFLLLWSNTLFAQGIGPKKNLFKVKKIKIDGVRKIEPEAILEKLSTTPGSILNNYVLRSDVKKVYNMKYFEDVEAYQESGDILVFKVKEKKVVRKIVFEGNDEIDEDDIREKLTLKEFNIIDVAKVKDDVTAIQKLYEEKGFYLAQVDYEIRNETNDSVDVYFKIREFDEVKVKKIQFIGNEAIEDSELKNFMITQEKSTFSAISEAGSFKDFNFQADIERLSYYYRTKGYLQINIGNPVITVSEDRKWIFITLNVTEGPQYKVREINFTGDLLFSEPKFIETTSLKTGDIYSEEKLRADIQNLTELYQDLGYAFVNVLRNLKPVGDKENPEVDIDFSFEKGKVAYFGNIEVRGNTKTRDKVVRRELRVHEGMKFSGSKLRISKENVSRLGFFEPGSIIFNTVARKNKDDVIDLIINVKERQTGQISIGAGYSTDTRGFLQASIRQNNFRGLGQDLNFSLALSQINQNYTLGLTEPYFLDTRWTVGGLVYKSRNSNITSFDFEKQGAELRVGHPVSEYVRAFITYSIEETDIQNVGNPTIVAEVENGIASGVEFSLIYDKRDNAFEPTRGAYGLVATELVGLGFDQRWLKTRLDGRFYFPLYKDLIFRSRVRVQQLFETSESRSIPRTEKFSMGGARNMRGYGIEDIGPQENLVDNRDNKVRQFNIGGLHSVLGTIELEHPLVKEAGLKWALFYDVGNVYRNYFGKDDDQDSFRQNFGFGIRWFSPIGVLRFEFGYPVDRKEGEAANQFFFDIGQIF